MIQENVISEELYNFLYLWLFLLCCLYIWTAGSAVSMKKYRYMIMSALICLLGFLGLNALRYIQFEKAGGSTNEMLAYISHLPFIVWIVSLILMSLYAAFLILQIRTWKNNHITPMSIKKCGDGHPAGIVFWNSRGRVLFSNAAADYLSISLQNTPILNGMEFWGRLGKNPLRLPDGSAWNYHHRILEIDGELVHELTAVDVTELDRKTKELETDTLRLGRMNEELKVYNRKIEELVRRQEILNAKVRIHDEMNHLLMATGRAFDETDRKKQNDILKLWEQDTSILFHDREDEQMNNIMTDLVTYGELIGIEFLCDGIPEELNQEQRRFVVSCTREAMNNAVKHSRARHLSLFPESEGNQFVFTYVNDGEKKPDKPIVPSGGLLQIKKESERFGGFMEIRTNPAFQLIITIPKEKKEK